MKSKHTKYYDNAIQTWTVRDVKKRECSQNNKLNYIVFWNLDEFDVNRLSTNVFFNKSCTIT